MSPEIKNVLNFVQMDENENVSRTSTSNIKQSLSSYPLYEINKMEMELDLGVGLPCEFGSKMDNEEIFYDAEALIQESMKRDSSFLVYQPQIESTRQNSIDEDQLSEIIKSEEHQPLDFDLKPINEITQFQPCPEIYTEFVYPQLSTKEDNEDVNLIKEEQQEIKEVCEEEQQNEQMVQEQVESKAKKRTLRFSCTRCLERFKSQNDRRAHYEMFHRIKKDQNIPCPHCGKKLGSEKGLKVHLAGFHSWKIEFHDCPFCQKSFQACDLADHIKQDHPNDRIKIPHVPLCPICMNRFSNLVRLRRHLATVHRDLRIKEEVESKEEKQMDIVVNSKPNILAEVISEGLNLETMESLEAKQPNTSLTPEPKVKAKLDTKCHLCSNQFCSGSSLKRHFISVHLLDKIDVTEKPLGVKTFCTICSAQMSSGTSYRRHMRTQHFKAFMIEEADKEAELEKLKLAREEKAKERQKLMEIYKSLAFDSLKNVQITTEIRDVLRVVSLAKSQEKTNGTIPVLPALTLVPTSTPTPSPVPPNFNLPAPKKISKDEKKKCIFCYQILCSKWSLRRHMKSCHPKEIQDNPRFLNASLECISSEEDEEELVSVSESESEIDDEEEDTLIGDVEGVNYFTCPACPQIFPLRFHLKRHCVAYHGVPWRSFENAFKSKRKLGLKNNIFWDGEEFKEDEEPVRFKYRANIGVIPNFGKLLSIRIHKLNISNY